MIPDLDVQEISIRTVWPGATPQDIEKEILIEQEDYLRDLPNLSRIVATASSGQAEIELEFPFGSDITDTLIRVNNALSQVPSYPENVDEPVIYANSFSSNLFMFFSVMPLAGNPAGLDIDLMLDFFEDNVKPAMALDDVRQAIRARNRDRSGGDVESGKRQYLLRTVGRLGCAGAEYAHSGAAG